MGSVIGKKENEIHKSVDEVANVESKEEQKKPLPEKPWLKHKAKKSEQEEQDVTEKQDNKGDKPKPRKKLPPKPWLKKKVEQSDSPHENIEEDESNTQKSLKEENKNIDVFKTDNIENQGLHQEKRENEIETTESSPPPPSKGYNLDFLDNVDNADFNPFETKTAIVDNFTDSKPTDTDTIKDMSLVQNNDESDAQHHEKIDSERKKEPK